ncbi:MAG: hypothetical protein ACKOT0_06690 [bacterium]
MATRDSDQFARVVQSGITKGMDVVEAWRRARSERPTPEERQLRAEHERAVALRRREVSRYSRRERRLQTQVTAGTAVAGVAGTIGVIDVLAEAVTSQTAVYGPSWMWVAAALTGGVVAIASRRARKAMPPPPRDDVPPPPPPPLPDNAIGAPESRRLAGLRGQLAALLPTMHRLHPDAAEELRRADLEAAPALHFQIERLAVLHRIRVEMPGTAADEAATSAAVEVRTRLTTGCETYEQLLAASATMLAAPDMTRGTGEILGPALHALSAYAHGLQRTAEALGQP